MLNNSIGILFKYSINPTAVSGVYRISYVGVATSNTTLNYGICKYTGQSDKGFTIIGNWQLEAKAYPTSFIAGVRAPESLTVPANCLNVAEGTIEFDLLVDSKVHNESSDWMMAFAVYGAPQINQISFRKLSFSSNWFVYTIGSVNASWTPYITMADGVHRLFISWLKSSGNLVLAVDGSIKSNLNSQHLPDTFINSIYGLQIGGWNKISYQIDTPISNFRVSNKQRTSAAELANTGALIADANTTYFMSLYSDLSATAARFNYTHPSGNTVVTTHNTSQSFVIPTLKKIGDISDTYDVNTGIVTHNIGVQNCSAGSAYTITGAITNSTVLTKFGSFTLSGTTLTYTATESFDVLFQLATPTTESLGANAPVSYYPTVSIDTTQDNEAESTIEATCKIMTS